MMELPELTYCTHAGCAFSGEHSEVEEHYARTHQHAVRDGRLTLTYHTLTKGDRQIRGSRAWLEQAGCEHRWAGARLEEHTHTYRVGQSVEVHSYGAWRPGRVTGLGRSQVEVTYARNKNGLAHTKRFPAGDIRPANR